WPISAQYLAQDDGAIKTVDVTSEAVDNYLGGNYIVTCIEGGLTAEAPTQPTVADGVAQANVLFHYAGEGDKPVEGATITFTAGGEAALTELSGVTDANGDTSVILTSIKAEEVEVCGEVGLAKACAPVQFTGDPATAQVVSVTHSDLSTWSDDKSIYVPITAKVEDANGNPVNNVSVQHNVLSNLGDCATCLDVRTPIADVNGDPVTANGGYATVEIRNTDTYQTDLSKHRFTHANTSNEVSNRVQEVVWTWSEIDVWLLNTNSSPLSTCQFLKGSGWRDMTSVERNQWIDANAGNNRNLWESNIMDEVMETGYVISTAPFGNELEIKIQNTVTTQGSYVPGDKYLSFSVGVTGTHNSTFAGLKVGVNTYKDDANNGYIDFADFSSYSMGNSYTNATETLATSGKTLPYRVCVR
ncbi:Ig-like domain-containing protein, partial [Vibrio jasicida]|uniref:Ig-like domain-containing protein n=1 Tax=Vibrio jasicida TaxID=766224 RepID=UPI0040696526